MTAGLKYMRWRREPAMRVRSKFVASFMPAASARKRSVRPMPGSAWAFESAVMLNIHDRPQEIVRQRGFIVAQMSRDDIQRAKRLLMQCTNRVQDCEALENFWPRWLAAVLRGR